MKVPFCCACRGQCVAMHSAPHNKVCPTSRQPTMWCGPCSTPWRRRASPPWRSTSEVRLTRMPVPVAVQWAEPLGFHDSALFRLDCPQRSILPAGLQFRSVVICKSLRRGGWKFPQEIVRRLLGVSSCKTFFLLLYFNYFYFFTTIFLLERS